MRSVIFMIANHSKIFKLLQLDVKVNKVAYICLEDYMKLETKRFKEFLEIVRGHVYSEPDTEMHTNTIDAMTKKVLTEYFTDSSAKLLDIGCGSGYAMQRMKDLGMTDLTGLTLSDVDANAARERGFAVVEEDMSFTTFPDDSFDYLWVRHALEHSPFPLLTLLEFHRILKPGGKIYIEMPSPQCTRLLEEYDNHYSIMGVRQWSCLMHRAKFEIKEIGEIKFDVGSTVDPNWKGTEIYEWYMLIK